MHPSVDPSLRLGDFDFVLPESCIAAQPMARRDAARLLHVRRDGLGDHHVFDLPSLLRPGDLLVLNDTKVIPARLYGTRGTVAIEILLNHRYPDADAACSLWDVLARPGKRLRPGDDLLFAGSIPAKVMGKKDDGQVTLRFELSTAELYRALEKHGHVPLPPYIKRPDGDTEEDRRAYQTVYARAEGAVAAPTAGLHFTPALFEALAARDIRTARVTLHVGAGTFLPVKTDVVAQHVMHAEWGTIDAVTAACLTQAKREGRRLVSVGTTSLRLLETAAMPDGTVEPFTGETSIFITPGYRFAAVDALMTNFHLPKSTLFMLVSAFAGGARMKEAYAHAIAGGYRFYSYGDASLLEKET
jgi:S-adenosylmethionine:tRNA ribosyltransferase-isomerase